MYKAKRILFFIFIFWQLGVSAQFKVRELKENSDPKSARLVFPVFTSKNKIADKKINEFLQTEILFTSTLKTPGKKLFEEAKYISGEPGQSGYTSMSYTIEVNNASMLSIFLEIETMGAYPEYYKRYFNFNSKNGDPLSTNQIFTGRGMAQIRKIIIGEREKRIKGWVSELKADDEKLFAEDSVFIVETFAKCNGETDEENFFISRGDVLFYKEVCFPHAWRPYDTDLNIIFSFKDVEKHLSDFGKQILFSNKAKK